MIGPLLKQEIENTFDIIRSRSSARELTFLCPEPGCGDESGNRSVHLKNGMTNCWRCGQGGNFVAWASKLGYNFSNATDFTAPVDLKKLFEVKPEQRSILPVIKAIKLPDGFTRMKDEPESVYTRFIGRMAVRKHLEPEDLVEANCGFTRKDPLWEPFAIFPVYEYGTPVYYQGRTYTDVEGQTTKKFPSNNVLEYGAKFWIYNIDELRESKAEIALVVESVLNVLSLKKYIRENNITGVVPVAVFKHRVSVEQFYKLSKIKSLKEICLLFDHDAITESWADARRFVNKYQITVAEMPSGPDNKKLDPNDDVVMGWQAFEARKIYDGFSALSRHKLFKQEAKAAQNTLAGNTFGKVKLKSSSS